MSMVKYHHTADLLFYWFAFDQTKNVRDTSPHEVRQRTLAVGGRIAEPMVFSFTRLELTKEAKYDVFYL